MESPDQAVIRKCRVDVDARMIDPRIRILFAAVIRRMEAGRGSFIQFRQIDQDAEVATVEVVHRQHSRQRAERIELEKQALSLAHPCDQGFLIGQFSGQQMIQARSLQYLFHGAHGAPLPACVWSDAEQVEIGLQTLFAAVPSPQNSCRE